MWTCDKCGKGVDPTNDAVDVTFLMQYGKRPNTMSKLNYGARHLLPTEDCEGSPSRAQYIEGQPRDERTEYPYDSEYEKGFRDAFAKLTAI